MPTSTGPSWATGSPRKRSAASITTGARSGSPPSGRRWSPCAPPSTTSGRASSWRSTRTARSCTSDAVWTAGCSGSTPVPVCEWYDVDYPAVIALREKIYPTRPQYHLVATSATDPSWLDQIPADRPVLLLAEGISMYLTEAARASRCCDASSTGSRPANCRSTSTTGSAIKSQKTQTLVRQSGSTLYWAVNGPQDILSRVPGLRLLTAATFFDASTFSRASTGLPVGEAPGSRGPAAAQGTAIPPLRVRARQLTPVAACCSAMAQRQRPIASIDFSGAGPCEWYSIISCPAKILLV